MSYYYPYYDVYYAPPVLFGAILISGGTGFAFGKWRAIKANQKNPVSQPVNKIGYSALVVFSAFLAGGITGFGFGKKNTETIFDS